MCWLTAVCVSFVWLWQNTWENPFTKKKKIYLGSWFQRLQSLVGWLHCFRPVARQYISTPWQEGVAQQSCSPHQPGSKRKKHGKIEVLKSLLGAQVQWTKDLLQDFFMVLSPPNSTCTGDRGFPHRPLEDAQHPDPDFPRKTVEHPHNMITDLQSEQCKKKKARKKL